MPERRRPLRSARFDDLGLRRALGDRMLPPLVAAMAFLASLALAGSAGTAALVRHWQEGAESALTVQVPAPEDAAAGGGGARAASVLAALQGTSGIAAAHRLTRAELADLLRPWLGAGGGDAALPLPAVIAVHLAGGGPDIAALRTRLGTLAPGTLVESHGVWVQRLSRLARSLQACAWLILAVVAAVATAVVAVATRAGLAARRDAIEIVHGLGATDGYIAARFARRTTRLAALGGLLGLLAGLPVLAALVQLVAPFTGPPQAATLPPELLIGLPALPFAAAAIGFATAQVTVRRWLKRLA